MYVLAALSNLGLTGERFEIKTARESSPPYNSDVKVAFSQYCTAGKLYLANAVDFPSKHMRLRYDWYENFKARLFCGRTASLK